MNCQWCGKDIYGMTGLQELMKYNQHLRKCKKAQGKQTASNNSGVSQELLELRVQSEKLYCERSN